MQKCVCEDTSHILGDQKVFVSWHSTVMISFEKLSSYKKDEETL